MDILTAIAVMSIGYVLFRDFTINYHIDIAKGLTGLVADLVDADRTLEFIEKGYAAADFSMGLISDYVRSFMRRVGIFFAVVIALTFIVRLLFMERGIFRSMKNMKTIAYRDSLTGVGSKAAYDGRVRQLESQIGSGSAEFAIVIVDVNFLKRVNDTCGHEKGNTYLETNARAITDSFGENDVYRIGGDEFAVILEGERASQAERLIQDFKALRVTEYSAYEPWTRVCAAVGSAHYDGDADVGSVFMRALRRCIRKSFP